MRKKCVIFLLVVILFLTACDNKQNDNKQLNSSNELKVSDLSIDNFKVEIEKVKSYGEVAYAATFINNSNYSVVAFQIDYKVKDDVTEEQLSIYNDFIQKYNTWLEMDDLTKIYLTASGSKLVENGNSIEKVDIFIGYDKRSWYTSPSKEQIDLMEPSELQIGIIGDDDVLYIAYYDYIENEWLIDEQKEQLNEWPKTKIAKIVKKPDCKYTLLHSSVDDEDEIDFSCYGIDNNMFNAYIEKLQDIGYEFEKANYSYGYYYDSVETSDGYEFTLDYDYDDEILRIELFTY